jgi:ribosomal protein S18 acetylase RimI-like enzyme
MEIVKAKTEDVPEILELIQECIRDMNANGIHQWNELYPPLKIFKSDVESGSLFAVKDRGRIAGIIVLSEKQDKEYVDIDWTDKSGKALIVHRLAVHPEFQRRGIAYKMMDFAENYAKEKGYTSIRVDTFSGNPRSLRFFEKLNYERKPGHIHFPENDEPYYCYEMIIDK